MLPRHERRSAVPFGMFAADRAGDLPHMSVQFDGQIAKLRHLVGIGQINKRPDVKLAVGRMAEDGGRDLQPPQRLQRLVQELRQHRGMHGDILDIRHRPRRTTESIERRHIPPRQVPKQLLIVGIEGEVRSGRQLTIARQQTVQRTQ
jgi:hypothetical protein